MWTMGTVGRSWFVVGNRGCTVSRRSLGSLARWGLDDANESMMLPS